jgi:hypothetical protein
MRHPVRAAIDRFNFLLGLREDPQMQDWEIECADPDRLHEFIDCYDQNAKSDDEKFTLIALILGSYEEYHSIHGPIDSEWALIKARLDADLTIHFDHVDYYSCMESDDPEEWFPITPQMRELHQKAAAQQGAAADTAPRRS